METNPSSLTILSLPSTVKQKNTLHIIYNIINIGTHTTSHKKPNYLISNHKFIIIFNFKLQRSKVMSYLFIPFKTIIIILLHALIIAYFFIQKRGIAPLYILFTSIYYRIYDNSLLFITKTIIIYRITSIKILYLTNTIIFSSRIHYKVLFLSIFRIIVFNT